MTSPGMEAKIALPAWDFTKGVITDPVATPTTSSIDLLNFSVILDSFLTLYKKPNTKQKSIILFEKLVLFTWHFNHIVLISGYRFKLLLTPFLFLGPLLLLLLLLSLAVAPFLPSEAEVRIISPPFWTCFCRYSLGSITKAILRFGPFSFRKLSWIDFFLKNNS